MSVLLMKSGFGSTDIPVCVPSITVQMLTAQKKPVWLISIQTGFCGEGGFTTNVIKLRLKSALNQPP